jgi:hypothetical protein
MDYARTSGLLEKAGELRSDDAKIYWRVVLFASFGGDAP